MPCHDSAPPEYNLYVARSRLYYFTPDLKVGAPISLLIRYNYGAVLLKAISLAQNIPAHEAFCFKHYAFKNICAFRAMITHHLNIICTWHDRACIILPLT
jgi:hypothetical protein